MPLHHVSGLSGQPMTWREKARGPLKKKDSCLLTASSRRLQHRVSPGLQPVTLAADFRPVVPTTVEADAFLSPPTPIEKLLSEDPRGVGTVQNRAFRDVVE